jgi:hypothetical protein
MGEKTLVFNEGLIAPCGINCGVCYAFLRDKNTCPGCRFLRAEIPVSIARCKIRNCEHVKQEKVRFCFECDDFVCTVLKHLDKRYRTRYDMSAIENLEYIKDKGMTAFLESEEKRWRCPYCEGVICVHEGYCLSCGK